MPESPPHQGGFFIVTWNMKKPVLAALLAFTFFLSYAQTRCNINKGYAYFTSSIGGAQMVDENGNPVRQAPHITRFIYIEWKGTVKPVIHSITYDNREFRSSISQPASRTVVAGKNPLTEKDIILRTRKGNSFWKLELAAIDEKQAVPAPSKNIVIKVKRGDKICTYQVLQGETELYSPPMY